MEDCAFVEQLQPPAPPRVGGSHNAEGSLMALSGDDGQGPVEAGDRQQEKGPRMLFFGLWGHAQPLREALSVPAMPVASTYDDAWLKNESHFQPMPRLSNSLITCWNGLFPWLSQRWCLLCPSWFSKP
jgi:hypothetical protein